MGKSMAFVVLILLVLSSAVSAEIMSLLGVDQAKIEGQKDQTSNTVSIDGGASAGTGSSDAGSSSGKLGFKIVNPERSYQLMYSFGTSKTVTEKNNDFGNFLLNPDLSNSFYGGYSKLKNKKWYGWYVYAGVAFAEFSSETAAAAGKPESISGLLAFGSGGLLLESEEYKPVADNVYRFGLQVGPAFRVLGGNIAQEKEFMQIAYGSRRKAYWGGELTIFTVLNNNLRPYIRVSYFDSDNDIKGFSGLQAFMGVDVMASLFQY